MTKGLNWDDLQFVISVARAGSYFRASTFLHTNASTIARRVQRMETALGAKLFDRCAHGMQLTPSGRILFDKAIEVEAITKDISAQLGGHDTSPAGIVKISITEGIGSFWLAPRLARFSEGHPAIDVEVITNKDGMSLLAHDADIAVALNRPIDPRLVVMRGAIAKLAFVASTAYAEKYGIPASIEEFAGHRFVDYSFYYNSPGVNDMLGGAFSGQRIVLKTNSASVLHSSIRAGLGIGLLPRFYNLSPVEFVELPIDVRHGPEIWLISHEETNKARRIRLLLNFLDNEFKTDRQFWI